MRVKQIQYIPDRKLTFPLLLLPTQSLKKLRSKKNFIGCCCCCWLQTNSSSIPTLSVKPVPLGTIPRERHGSGSPSGFPQRRIIFLVCHICCPPDYRSAILRLTCGWHLTSGTLCTPLHIVSTFTWNQAQVPQGPNSIFYTLTNISPNSERALQGL